MKKIWVAIIIIIVLFILTFILLKEITIFHMQHPDPSSYYICKNGEPVARGSSFSYKPYCFFTNTKSYGLVELKEDLYCENNTPILNCKVSLWDLIFNTPDKTFSR